MVQVKARGADLIVITDNPKLARGLVPDPVVIPSNGPLTALIATLPLQLLAYELAILKVRAETDRSNRNKGRHQWSGCYVCTIPCACVRVCVCRPCGKPSGIFLS